MIKKLSPQIQYTLVGLILIILSLFSFGALDIAVHDTYFIIDHRYIFIGVAVIYFIFAIIAWGVSKIKKTLNRILFLIHFWVTSIGILVQFLIHYLSIISISKIATEDYYAFDTSESYSILEDYNKWIAIGMIPILVGQFVFLVAMAKSIFAKK